MPSKRIKTIQLNKELFQMKLFLVLYSNLPRKHYIADEMFKWRFYFKGNYFGIRMNVKDSEIFVYYKGECIQFFTSIEAFENWLVNGCTKKTIFMMKDFN